MPPEALARAVTGQVVVPAERRRAGAGDDHRGPLRLADSRCQRGPGDSPDRDSRARQQRGRLAAVVGAVPDLPAAGWSRAEQGVGEPRTENRCPGRDCGPGQAASRAGGSGPLASTVAVHGQVRFDGLLDGDRLADGDPELDGEPPVDVVVLDGVGAGLGTAPGSMP